MPKCMHVPRTSRSIARAAPTRRFRATSPALPPSRPPSRLPLGRGPARAARWALGPSRRHLCSPASPGPRGSGDGLGGRSASSPRRPDRPLHAGGGGLGVLGEGAGGGAHAHPGRLARVARREPAAAAARARAAIPAAAAPQARHRADGHELPHGRRAELARAVREAGGALHKELTECTHLVVADDPETSRKVDAARRTSRSSGCVVSASWLDTQVRGGVCADEQLLFLRRRPPPRVVELRDFDLFLAPCVLFGFAGGVRRRRAHVLVAAAARPTQTPMLGARDARRARRARARTGPGRARRRRPAAAAGRRCGGRPRGPAGEGAVAPRLRGAKARADADHADAAEGEGE